MTDNPFIKDVQLVRYRQGMDLVLLDRIEPGVTPEYCVHGRTTCCSCNEWCWLGDKTHDVVASGKAAPLCLQCANEKLPKPSKIQGPVTNLRDHRRADGPHAD